MYLKDRISKRYISNKFFFFLLVFFLNGLNSSFAQISTQSVLKEGEWWQFSIEKRGMYKITGKMLKEAGMNLSRITPSNIRFFKNDGGSKPQRIAEIRVDDLKEMVVQVISSNDILQETDYILFYVLGPHRIQFEESHQQFRGFKNIYDNHSFIYIKPYDTNKGLRIKPYISPTIATQDYTVFDEYKYIENDLTKLLYSGREWLGEAIENQKTFTFEPSSLSPTGKIKIHIISASAYSYNFSTQFLFALNDVILGNQEFPSLLSQSNLNREYAILGIKKENNFEIDLNQITPTNSLNLKCSFFSINDSLIRGYIDRVSLTYPAVLAYPSNGFLLFRSIDSKKNEQAKFIFQNTSDNHTVWLVTNSYNPQKITMATTNQKDSFIFNTQNVIQEFIVFKNDFLVPIFVNKIENQNLHGLEPAQLLIIAPEKFISLAAQWKDWREQHNRMTVQIASTEAIFHEFSGGAQDVVAIRDFVKMMFDRGNQGNNPQNKLQSLLLLGDASYDYLSKQASNTNQLPIYESYNSLDPIESYSSDDFYTLLESNEGNWEENATDNSTLDIGVGRIPINNIAEGQQVLNKIKHYETSVNTIGEWRNKILLVADDEDQGLHMKDAELMALTIQDNSSDFFVYKMYLDDYKQTSTGAKETSTEFQTALHTAFEKGVLIFNYSGHGREDLLAEENILDRTYVQSMKNINRLPLFVTATCQFGRIDNPHLDTGYSGAERALLNPNGGAIALFSTGRPVYAFSNQKINKTFYEYVFDKKNGQYLTLGEILKLTKNNSLLGVNNRNFMLIGDPSMTLNYPKNKVVIKQFQGQSIANSQFIHAQKQTQISGEIQYPNGEKIENFNGFIDLTLFDHPQPTTTLGYQQTPFRYERQSSIIFKGIATVDKGDFNFTFFVPKTIDFTQNNKLKILTYALDQTNKRDANGSNINLMTGNTQSSSPIDYTPPTITLKTIKENENYFLITNYYDKSGINLTNNVVSNGVQVTVNKGNAQSLIPFYTPVIDDPTMGNSRWPMGILSDGEYIITVVARDTWNNSSTKSITIFVGEKNRLINQHIVYPNPARTNEVINFIIYHNGYDEAFNLEIKIFSAFSEIIFAKNITIPKNQGIINDIKWIPLANFAVGQYFYHIQLSSNDTIKTDQIQGKILFK